MKEAGFQRKVAQDLEALGYYVVKLITTNKNGIPDLIALKPNEVRFFEVKTPTGKTSKLQDFRIEELRSKGFKVDVGSSLTENLK